MQPLIDLLHASIVRITPPGESGSGFFVAPQYILTCTHVVLGMQIGECVSIFWRAKEYSAQLESTIPAPYPDLALLHVKREEEDHPCVFFDEEVHVHDMLYSYGFPDGYPEGSPSDFVYEGLTGGQAPLLTFKAGEVRPGFSGSPLLNLRTGNVCGMIRLTRGEDTLMGGRAIPVSTILQHFPRLIEDQHLFHTRDRRWSQRRAEHVQHIGVEHTSQRAKAEQSGDPPKPTHIRVISTPSREGNKAMILFILDGTEHTLEYIRYDKIHHQILFLKEKQQELVRLVVPFATLKPLENQAAFQIDGIDGLLTFKMSAVLSIMNINVEIAGVEVFHN